MASGETQVLLSIFDATNNALRISATPNPPASPAGATNADQIYTSIFDAVNNAIQVECISGCSGGGGGSTAIKTNGVLTTDQTTLNMITSVTNTLGLTVTPSNPTGANVKYEITGTAAQTAKSFLATPTGTTGAVSLRVIAAADVPTLNQNTTGSAASFTGSLVGDVTGTQGATVVGALNGISLAGLSTGILKNTTTTGVPSIAIAADFPTLNQNTTGTAANVTGTVAVNHGGTGTASTLTGLVRGSSSAMTAAELSLDASTSGSNAVTVVGLRGLSLPTLAASTGFLHDTAGALDLIPLPTATTSTYGVIKGGPCGANQFVSSLDINGVLVCTTAPGAGSVGISGSPVANQFAFWSSPTSLTGRDYEEFFQLASPPSTGTTSIQMFAPAAVTSYQFKLPAAAATGFLRGTNAANLDTLSFASASGVGTCTNQAVTALTDNAAPTCTTLTSSYIDTSIATTGGDIDTSTPSKVTKINGTSFAGTSGHLVSFGAANIPADSNVVAANVLTGTATNHGVAFGGAAQALGFSAAGVSGAPLLSGGASANGAYGALDLTGGSGVITGSLPVGNGGTGFTSGTVAQIGVDINSSNQVTATHLASALPIAQGGTAGITASAAFLNLATFGTTVGDLIGCSHITTGACDTWTRVPANTSNTQWLQETSSGVWSWSSPPGTAISGLTTNTIPKAASSTTLTNSTLSDNGTVISTTEPVQIGGNSGVDINCAATPATVTASFIGFEVPTTCASNYGHYKLPLLPSSAGVFLVGAAASNLSAVTVGTVPNSDLTNPATTVNGATCTLGSTCNVNGTNTANTIALNAGAGVALGATAADSTTTHALFATAGAPAFRAVAVGDIPTLNQNTTGTSGNVTGTVAISHGGTGAGTATAGFDALSPMTTAGDIIYGGTSGTGTRLAAAGGSDFLLQGASAAAPAWLAVNSCSAAASALTYNTSTHAFGCNTITTGGSVTSVGLAGTANQITVTGATPITTSGSWTLSLPAALSLGTDNTTAGTLTLANGSAAAHTVWSSGATTTNTIAGFTAVPTTGHLVTCTVVSTTCTLTDGGAVPAGTVTSIATTAPLAGGTITGTGTLSITGLAGGVLAGSTPSFVYTPTFGDATHPGSLTLADGGTLTLNGSTSGSCPLTVTATAGTLNLCSTSATVTSTGALSAPTVTTTGQITTTQATGTAPFVVSSTTAVANLNASLLNGATFAAPGTIGGTTPGAATFTSGTVQNGLSVGGTAYSYGAPSTTGAAALLTPATTYTVTGTATTANFQGDYHGVATFTDASAGTVTDAFDSLLAGPAAAAGSLTITRAHTLGIVDSTSASSSITGGLVVATGLGTTATSVGIGAGNVNAGGNGTFGGTLAVTGHATLEGVTSTGATGTGKLVFDGTPTLVTPVIGAATGTSLLATGIVDGQAPMTVTTSTPITLGGTYKSGYTINEHATAGTAITYNLPTAAAGLQYCVGNGYNGSAANTGVITVATSASGQFIIFTDGTLSATGGNVTSGGAGGDFSCFVGVDSTHWYMRPGQGTWTKH